MKNPTQTIAAIIFLLMSMLFGYRPWFRSKEFLDAQRERRKKQKVKHILLPHAITAAWFNESPSSELWSARVISVSGILICIVILLSPLF